MSSRTERWEFSALKDQKIFDKGFTYLEERSRETGIMVAGADEAGRGPLAGPVVAAAVIMPNDHFIEGIDDSKKLTEKKREKLFDLITSEAISYGVGIVSNEEIDATNILIATRKAFVIAIGQLKKPYVLYTDYITGLDPSISYTAFVKGDASVYSIAAASIIAKVTRDRILTKYSEMYPEYGFEKHKGYGTKLHYEAIQKYGLLPVHRKSFLKKYLTTDN
ncbi:MAG: ribonuclease HII [Clostridia bacterium]|nr:ribonuclease HII [Clostridia bacterium]